MLHKGQGGVGLAEGLEGLQQNLRSWAFDGLGLWVVGELKASGLLRLAAAFHPA